MWWMKTLRNKSSSFRYSVIVLVVLVTLLLNNTFQPIVGRASSQEIVGNPQGAMVPNAQATAAPTVITAVPARTPTATGSLPTKVPQTATPILTKIVSPTPQASATASPTAVKSQLPLAGDAVQARQAPSAALMNIISTMLQGEDGTYGVAIKNLSTGEYAFFNADSDFEAASLYKLPVMYETFKQWQAGDLSLDEEITVSEHAAYGYDDGDPTLDVGTSITIADAVERMITFSDNTAAHMLLDRLGVWQINQTAKQIGLDQTQILDGVRTSPYDTLRLLELIATNQAVDAESSQMMLRLLLNQEIRDRIPRLLPADVPVANKTGNLVGVRNDAGIVYGPSGPYIIVVMAEDLADDDQGSLVIAELSRAVYDYFNPPQPQL